MGCKMAVSLANVPIFVSLMSVGLMCTVCKVGGRGYFLGVLQSGFGSYVRFRCCIWLRSDAPVNMISVGCNILWVGLF